MPGTAHTAVLGTEAGQGLWGLGGVFPLASQLVLMEALYKDRVDPVPPASSTLTLHLGQFPFWQPLLGSTATSSRKSCLILLVEGVLPIPVFPALLDSST